MHVAGRRLGLGIANPVQEAVLCSPYATAGGSVGDQSRNASRNARGPSHLEFALLVGLLLIGFGVAVGGIGMRIRTTFSHDAAALATADGRGE